MIFFFVNDGLLETTKFTNNPFQKVKLINYYSFIKIAVVLVFTQVLDL